MTIILRLNLSHLNLRLNSNAPPPSPPLPCWAVVDGNDEGAVFFGYCDTFGEWQKCHNKLFVTISEQFIVLLDQ